MTRLEFTRTTKRYGHVTAVDDLTFAPVVGRVTGFVGNNGAGKSTSMRMLLGLTRPTSGSATVDGKPYAELRDPLRAVGAMVDPNVFHPGRSGRNALRVLARAARIPDSRVDDVLGQVDLADAAGRRVGGYSMGMRQRLGLAAARHGDPAAQLLGETAHGRDPHGVHWRRQLIRGLAGEGRTVLVSSHLLAELAQTADDVAVIDRGRLVTHQPMSELLASAAGSSLEDVFFSLTSPGSDRS
jgi:ABC-2 type transport system ATP-binding protein